jgi:exosortase
LDGIGYSVLREGNILELVGERLNVAEACSGIRALGSLLFFALAYNYFFVSRMTIRLALLLAVIPFAVLGNAGRIIATGIVGQYNRALAHGMLHETWGFVTVLIAAVLLLVLHATLDRIHRIGYAPR